VVAFTALLLLPLVAFTGLAVDLGAWHARAAHLQAVADAAALAGVTYLPDEEAARAQALEVAARNGERHGVDGLSVRVDRTGPARLRVAIVDDDVEHLFAGVFVDEVRLTRRATAEHLRPIPMGSPRNHLGTNALHGAGPAREDFWLSVSGYCARRETGERLTAVSDANGAPRFDGCVPGGGTRANPEFRPEGYHYAVELDDGDRTAGEPWPYAPVVEVYDGAHCQGAGTDASDGGSVVVPGRSGVLSGERAYSFRVLDNDSLRPATASLLREVRLTPDEHCGSGPASWATGWRVLHTLGGATEGIYFVQVRPEAPADRLGADSQEGNNQFALRVRDPSWGERAWACTADPAEAVPEAPVRPGCPRVYGWDHLGVFAAARGADPSFTLAEIGPAHAGRRVAVELFDPAEGARTVEILDPRGDPVEVTWEIGCHDGTSPSREGGCPDGERPPVAPGWGPGRTSALDVCRVPTCHVGTAHRPWGARNIQGGTYSDRLVRLTFTLPSAAEEPTWFDGRSWFRIRYTVTDDASDAGTLRDRTTWSIRILGDPVRLVE
jgi:hypothetical protein